MLKSSDLATLLAPTHEMQAAVGTLDDFKKAEEMAEKTNVWLDENRKFILVDQVEARGSK